MKDNFSKQAPAYAAFRPGYPPGLFDLLYRHCPGFERAWDCATGNGQVAVALAEKFAHVDATDISERQLENAMQRPNIHYRLAPAESPDFPDRSFDLITVGQAAHWFHLDDFYREVRRLLRPNGVLALITYNLLEIDPLTDALVRDLYWNTLEGHWDEERRLVDENYTTLPFPFSDEIKLPALASAYPWKPEQLVGYLNTWSGLQHFIRNEGYSPLDGDFTERLLAVWPAEEVRMARFPIFGRAARLS